MLPGLDLIGEEGSNEFPKKKEDVFARQHFSVALIKTYSGSQWAWKMAHKHKLDLMYSFSLSVNYNLLYSSANVVCTFSSVQAYFAASIHAKKDKTS